MDNKFLRRDVIQAQSQRLMLLLRWQAACLGNTGKVGVGLLVVAGIFLLGAVLPEKKALEALQARENILKQQIRSGSDGAFVVAQKLTNDQALQKFYDFFPRFDSSPFWIRELVRVARKQGLEINSGDFRLTFERDWRLSRYDITMPVTGRYAQIRAFMADALEAVPAMAITGFSIKRDNIQSAQLEVRFEMRLYLNE
ncbi:hypothetical protein SAMN05421690_100557 [Nitrosomonas sp. Nm51]|uniref:hypothetical protein n=1 Tax=Nitrosomonas sp. Nm51 TaxID=133720 RepID=UPI0008B6144F|nr:hypothetical protein [Nitrosomonas sp. Nm51]SEQ99830.1 hypothetical protein SAMN05421690_100557 [Nitrosomonas sp. Nm51]